MLVNKMQYVLNKYVTVYYFYNILIVFVIKMFGFNLIFDQITINFNFIFITTPLLFVLL